MLKSLSASVLAVFFLFGFLLPANALEPQPEISARAAVLMDAATGVVLYEKNPTLPHPPASLTKVMTIHILLEKIAAGELSLDERITPPRESWAVNLPRDSSLMFLGPGQRLTVLDLLKGLAVSSGNDAALAAALITSGSVPAFAGLMNAAAQKENLDGLFFVEPSGYDAQNRITAMDFARFLRIYVNRHPEALAMLHSLEEFTYPRPENLLPGNGSAPITQFNRNSLLFSYTGVDGIKTGYLDESGYNIALSAGHEDMRLILVLLGERGSTQAEGISSRNADARRLLDFGFNNFTNRSFDTPAPQPVRVWKGEIEQIIPEAPKEIRVTVPRGSEGRLKGEISQAEYITAPVGRGAVLGSVKITLDEKIVYQGNLTSPQTVGRGSWWDIFIDSVIIFFRELFGYPV
ncbi:MAG: D-alanyl-D-alanine carboxypeptidase [Spirochaetales bacterium]|jgi:D-alanyl-D-alanine carboxypeptidase (penicillin-binding protein 5/6)|nr:D-alanyl-D-alanine carboxypeptidase [Spirochaetales bacterium]